MAPLAIERATTTSPVDRLTLQYVDALTRQFLSLRSNVCFPSPFRQHTQFRILRRPNGNERLVARGNEGGSGTPEEGGCLVVIVHQKRPCQTAQRHRTAVAREVRHQRAKTAPTAAVGACRGAPSPASPQRGQCGRRCRSAQPEGGNGGARAAEDQEHGPASPPHEARSSGRERSGGRARQRRGKRGTSAATCQPRIAERRR